MFLYEKKLDGKLTKQITSPDDIAHEISKVLKKRPVEDSEKEHVFTIGLDSMNQIKYIELVAIGILNSSLIHPREVFRQAIIKNAASIIIAHNHPSGNLNASELDIAVTDQLCKAGKIIDIKVRDHVIVIADGKFTSLAKLGYVY